MKYCQNCGNQIDDKAKFCPVCGVPQQIINNQQIQYNNPSQNQNFTNYHAAITEKKKTGCGTILLWIFFFPIMLWVHAFKKKQVSWYILAAVVSILLISVLFGGNRTGINYSAAPKTEPNLSLYRTVDYEDCARYPEKYKGSKALLEGTVIQIMGTKETGFTIRLATSGSFEDIYFLTVNYNPGFNILQNDNITVYAELTGTQSYQAVLGNNITIPSARADWIELQK